MHSPSRVIALDLDDDELHVWTYYRSEIFQLLKKFGTMRKQGILCDVTLTCGGTEIRAHRFMLAASSQFFYTMFTSNFIEMDRIKIDMPSIEPSTLEKLVGYAYDCKLPMNHNTAQELIMAANMLGMQGVLDRGCYFLEAELHPSNALGIYAFAKDQHLVQLKVEAENFIRTYFVEIVKQEEFCELDFDKFADLIASPRLTVQKELQVFDAVLSWVKFKPEARVKFLAALLRHVRLELVPRQVLFVNVLLRNYLDVELLPHPVITSKLQAVTASSETGRQLPRVSAGQPQNILVFCGDRLTTSVNVFDVVERDWWSLPLMHGLERRTRSQIAVSNNKLFVLGGYCGGTLRSTQVFNFATKQWRIGPHMFSHRSSFAAASLYGRIFVTGGIKISPLRSSEVLDTRLMVWRDLPPMRQARAFHGSAFLRDKLYVVGGKNKDGPLCSVECYDPRRNTWVFTTEMKFRRNGVGVGVINDRLYAIGGSDRFSASTSVEVFDPNTQTWTEVSPMIKPRRQPGVVTHNDRLIVIGGDESDSPSTTVEIYDPRRDRWYMHKSPMACTGVHVSATTISKYVC